MDRPLTRDELVAFRRRYRQAQVGLGVMGVTVIVLWASVSWSLALWIAVLLAFALICLAIEYRGQRCPRCGKLVFGAISEDTEGINLFGAPPTRCRSCGVSLLET